MRPCLVKQQSSLLSECQIAPLDSILMRFPSIFLCGTILRFLKSHGVSSIQLSTSIGFTKVKNIVFRWDFVSRNQSTSDYWMHFTHIPDVQMYSVDPFGNSTLSCNSGSKTIPPKSPWIALKYRMCLEELGFKQYWHLFFLSSSSGQNRYQIVEWPLQSTHRNLFFFWNSSTISSNYHCSFGFPRNCLIMSKQSDHCFWYDVALSITTTRIDVHPTFFRVEERRRVSASLLISFEVLL